MFVLERANSPMTLLFDDYYAVACQEIKHIVHTLIEQAAPWLQLIMCAIRARDTELVINLVGRCGGWTLVLRYGIHCA